jgi:uncharacterized protein YrrD
MIKAQSIIGKPLLSRADGEKLDSVKDVIIGKDHTRVIALLISEGGLFGKPTVVPIESVVSFGKDAVVITDSQAAMRADHVPAVAEALDMNEKLDGKKVYAETGDQHGKLDDIYFDEKTGNIMGVDVIDMPGASSKKVAYLDIADIISFGSDAVVINAGAVSKLVEPAPSPPSGPSSTANPSSERTVPPDIEMEMPTAATTDAPPAVARLAGDSGPSGEQVDSATGPVRDGTVGKADD